jgi:hypothetical protein
MNTHEARRLVRRMVRREVGKQRKLMMAITHVKLARDAVNALPDRAQDSDGHDVCVMTMHAHTKAANAYFSQFWASGQDDKRYSGSANASRDDLSSAINHIKAAGDAADEFPDTDSDEAEIGVRGMHEHIMTADSALERYRAAVTENPQAEAAAMRRRDVARGWAGAMAARYG